MRSHTYTEERVGLLLKRLLQALAVAIGIPMLRWLLLLPAMLSGAHGGSGFTLVIAPVMTETSVAQLIMITSWTTYRFPNLFASSTPPEEPPAREEPRRTQLPTPPEATRKPVPTSQPPTLPHPSTFGFGLLAPTPAPAASASYRENLRKAYFTPDLPVRDSLGTPGAQQQQQQQQQQEPSPELVRMASSYSDRLRRAYSPSDGPQESGAGALGLEEEDAPEA